MSKVRVMARVVHCIIARWTGRPNSVSALGQGIR